MDLWCAVLILNLKMIMKLCVQQRKVRASENEWHHRESAVV